MRFPLKFCFSLCVLVLGLVCVGMVLPIWVQASANVSGIIETDTVWTRAISPYNLTANVLVSNGVTLTIEPGVTVNLNGYYIMVNGTLNARGTSSDYIFLNNGGSIKFTDFSSDWNEQSSSGSIIEYANLTLPQSINIEEASPKISNSYLNTTIIVSLGSPLISNNRITGYSNGGVIIVYGGSPVILNNYLKNRDNFVHYGVSFSGPNSAFVSGNTINSFRSSGIGVMPGPSYENEGVPIFERNNITWNPIGIDIRIDAIIRNNTIASNSIGILRPLSRINNYVQ